MIYLIISSSVGGGGGVVPVGDHMVKTPGADCKMEIKFSFAPFARLHLDFEMKESLISKNRANRIHCCVIRNTGRQKRVLLVEIVPSRHG